jgi:hypothetical protein
MPFTLAHPAIVLPFKYLNKRWFSMTGLVIGSMTPDFEYFIRLRVKSIYSHTLGGLFWFDIPLGLLLVFIYQRLIKNTLIDHLPVSLNRRFAKYNNVTDDKLSISGLAIIMVSVAIGALSHIFWDAFTHPAGYFVTAIPVLSTTVNLAGYHLYLYKVLQHGSTFLGITFIVITIWFLPKSNISQSSNLKLYWFIVLLIMAFTIGIRLLTGIGLREYGNLIVTAMAGGILGILFASLIVDRCRSII